MIEMVLGSIFALFLFRKIIFRYFYRRRLFSLLKEIEKLLRRRAKLDYQTSMVIALDGVEKTLPKGLAQTPCPATRALCVDYTKFAIQASNHENDSLWAALSCITVYFSAWNLSYHNPHDHAALALRNRAKAIIDSILAPNVDTSNKPLCNYSTFNSWYEAYVNAADDERPGIGGLLGFMDKTSLIAAYNDGIEPISLGRGFAESFDVEKFGQ